MYAFSLHETHFTFVYAYDPNAREYELVVNIMKIYTTVILVGGLISYTIRFLKKIALIPDSKGFFLFLPFDKGLFIRVRYFCLLVLWHFRQGTAQIRFELLH